MFVPIIFATLVSFSVTVRAGPAAVALDDFVSQCKDIHSIDRADFLAAGCIAAATGKEYFSSVFIKNYIGNNNGNLEVC